MTTPHPLCRTPIRRKTVCKVATRVAQHSDFAFERLMRIKYSKTYDIPKEDKIHSLVKDYTESVKGLKEMITGKQVQGIYRQPDVLTSQIFGTVFLLDHPLVPMTENQSSQLSHFKNTLEEIKVISLPVSSKALKVACLPVPIFINLTGTTGKEIKPLAVVFSEVKVWFSN